jgi:hypothetical protein
VTCHTVHMARVQCKAGIKCLSCAEKQEGPTQVAQKCGHKFHISLRSKVRRHRDTKHQLGLPNLLLALLVLTTSAYSNLGVSQGFEPLTTSEECYKNPKNKKGQLQDKKRPHEAHHNNARYTSNDDELHSNTDTPVPSENLGSAFFNREQEGSRR